MFPSIAGGGLSTDELYSDARAAPPGTAAQDTTGDGQCLPAGAPDRVWAIASVEFSAQSAAALAGGNGQYSDGAAHGGWRSFACYLPARSLAGGRGEQRGPGRQPCGGALCAGQPG